MSIYEEYKNPPKEYSLVPFWFWNGTLEEDRLREQIRMMADKGVYGAFMHARAYLRTPYLEDEWWDAVDACVDEGKKTGFKTWLYDEYAWPSGTAGSTFEYSYQKYSRTLSKGPAFQAKGLFPVYFTSCDRAALTDEVSAVPNELVALYAVEKVQGEPVIRRYVSVDEMGTDIFRNVEDNVEFVGFFVKLYPDVVDYMNYDAIAYFIEETHEKYAKRYGEEFGKTIPGIFFDEIYMVGNPLPWTNVFEQTFREKKGYDILEQLPLLILEEGRELRKDYYEVVTWLYEHAFFEQIGDWCEKHGISLTGHTEEELLGHPNRQGNFFRTMRHLQIPGSDCHDYRYRLPRKISYHEGKWAVSVARAYGKERAMSESMGGAGWGCSLQEYRRGLHTQAVLGLNMLILHGMYYSCEHQGSQADWPASFFYQNPYWKYFDKFADEARRLCYINTVGRPVVSTALYYPIKEVYAGTVLDRPDEVTQGIGADYIRIMYYLLEHQIDVDVLDEDCLLGAKIKDGCILSGQREIKVLLFPKKNENSDALYGYLEAFEENGGHIIWYSPEIPAEEIAADIVRYAGYNIRIVAGDTENILISQRQTENENIFMISNSDDRPKRLSLRVSNAEECFVLYPEDGHVEKPVWRMEGQDVMVNLELKEDEAVCLLVPRTETGAVWWNKEAVPCKKERYTDYQIVTGPWSFLPLQAEYDSQWGDTADRSEIEIPIAVVSSSLNPVARKIRICNTSWEEGWCGRHLSLWKASWIGRRISWRSDCAEASDLYFRKKFDLERPAVEAKICVAAVNACDIYVNGKFVTGLKDCLTPQTVEIYDYLQEGSNLLAIHVHNDKPYYGHNFASVETMPKDRLISLLAEGYVRCQNGSKAEEPDLLIRTDSSWIVTASLYEDWEKACGAFEDIAEETDVSGTSWTGDEKTWFFAWERGCPPLLPWGELPLFDREVPYPLEVTYQITLPVGTARVEKPKVEGKFTCRIDGMPVDVKKDSWEMIPEGRTKHMEIIVQAESARGGLKAPVRIVALPAKITYESWKALGLEWFSGRCMYQNRFNVKQKKSKYMLVWGQSNSCAEVWINHKLVGVRTWGPYEMDITEEIAEGKNEISIIVANLAAPQRLHSFVDEGVALAWNRYWNEDNMLREGEDLLSGLMGPVRIYTV